MNTVILRHHAFQAFHLRLKEAAAALPADQRPHTFSATYWARRTLTIIRNIDNWTVTPPFSDTAGVRTNPSAAMGHANSVELLPNGEMAQVPADATSDSSDDDDLPPDDFDVPASSTEDPAGSSHRAQALFTPDADYLRLNARSELKDGLPTMPNTDPYLETVMRMHDGYREPVYVAGQMRNTEWRLPTTCDRRKLARNASDWTCILEAGIAINDTEPSEGSCSTHVRDVLCAPVAGQYEVSPTSVWQRALRNIANGECDTRAGLINRKQAAYHLVFAAWLQELMDHVWLKKTSPVPRMSSLLLGGPGSGKTHMLNLNRALLEEFIPNSCISTSFMHTAARLIGGQTFHGALKIPIEPWSPKNRSLGKQKEQCRLLWGTKHLLRIDEISMLSAENFCRGEFRSRQVKNNPELEWGGLSLEAAGDFMQLPPVKAASLAADPVQPKDMDLTARTAWESDHEEAISGRKLWKNIDRCILLDYSHRCAGALCTLLYEMTKHGKLSQDSWAALQNRVLTHPSAQETRQAYRQAPFACQDCPVGVLRHSVRASFTYERAVGFARASQQRLLVAVASDRCTGQSANFQLQSAVYKDLASVHNLSTTAHLPNCLFLWRGVRLTLEEKMCVELGVVRGCAAVVLDILPDEREPLYDQGAHLEPFLFRYVPEALIMEVPGATWLKEPELGPGRFYLGRAKRNWKYNVSITMACHFPDAATTKKPVTINRVQLPVTNMFALTVYALQGQTLPAIIVDVARPPGMSRVKSLVVFDQTSTGPEHVLQQAKTQLEHSVEDTVLRKHQHTCRTSIGFPY
jgi:hypothetical protein